MRIELQHEVEQTINRISKELRHEVDEMIDRHNAEFDAAMHAKFALLHAKFARLQAIERAVDTKRDEDARLN